MAAINFLYRSTREEAQLTLRLLYRHEGKDYVYATRSKEKVTKQYWGKTHRSNTRDAAIQNQISEVKANLSRLSKFVIQHFDASDPKLINKKWLQDVVKNYYTPIIEVNDYPKSLIPFIDIYVTNRKNEITTASVKKFNVIKHKMQRLEKHRGAEILIKEVNENFKIEFEKYYLEHSYSQNTMQREFSLIKTICKYAKSKGINTHPELDVLKFKREKTHKIYLNEKEIEAVSNLNDSDISEYLINARDWLIISCFTGQRISDFMRFAKNMIREENGKQLLEFTQKKTGKEMTIPVHPEVLKVLNKRNGEFPRLISDQRYNEYIKEVCKAAKIIEVVSGKKQVNIADFGEKKQIRSVSGKYPKYELVTSHIGRRSFATNFYGKIPTTYLIYVTGHSSETMFLNYIGKSNKDLAMELTNYF